MGVTGPHDVSSGWLVEQGAMYWLVVFTVLYSVHMYTLSVGFRQARWTHVIIVALKTNSESLYPDRS